jgi:hypothetical protein
VDDFKFYGYHSEVETNSVVCKVGMVRFVPVRISYDTILLADFCRAGGWLAATHMGFIWTRGRILRGLV